MKYWAYTYFAVIIWFFAWLRPRVEDGRIEEIYNKIEKRIKRK